MTRSMSKGFAMTAAASRAFWWAVSSPAAESSTTGTLLPDRFCSARKAQPSMTGIMRSSRLTHDVQRRLQGLADHFLIVDDQDVHVAATHRAEGYPVREHYPSPGGSEPWAS